MAIEGAAHLIPADGVVPPHPAEAMFEAMLTGPRYGRADECKQRENAQRSIEPLDSPVGSSFSTGSTAGAEGGSEEHPATTTSAAIAADERIMGKP
ncbi:hypothetical protein ACFWTE_07955 [Nocardiopsis sp. NPDC058631]|uniref:hypothetical protein n=1 Tax=Nocardiopsis sp. NPDC058631 TaxID=3346566 RepID=UPI00365C0E0C